MNQKFLVFCFLLLSTGCASVTTNNSDNSTPTIDKSSSSLTRGFFDFRWDEAQGKVFLHVSNFKSPFIYQTSLARGIGSNDIGADRGRLGDTKLVEFYRSGNRLLLIENNVAFQAISSNIDEQNAVTESFARSVIWGFEIERIDNDVLIVDATDFLLRDSMSLSQWLADMKQGNYKVDRKRSAIYLPRTRSFKDNTEFEAILTLTGTPQGELLESVVPDTTAITVHTHHSFVRLPDSNYEPLPFDPRTGYMDPSSGGSFSDYAVPINQPLKTRFTRRHRLHKKDPAAAVSEAIDPIIYYLDSGAPEPVRTALLEGARWWNQAFEAAGYKNAFQVKMLPADADPLDVRYNVIQWVHRSTRGWSYGASVLDPRTGEIIKGHVSLGSLRVRQDYLLAEGLLAPYTGASKSAAMEALALARIRQLSAHEVGHTIGLAHNFAGSVDNRSSVMDYPFPLVTIDATGAINLDDAYAENIGDWDKRAIIWGYQDIPEHRDAVSERAAILKETLQSGLKFVADSDSRHRGSAHVYGNLWDNGADPVDELIRLMTVREKVLDQFSPATIQHGQPLATIEEVLVPMYLLHRYQLQAAGKVLGGGYFNYALKGDSQPGYRHASAKQQRRALTALLNTLSPKSLQLPEHIVTAIPPRPPGYTRDRETFDRKTRQIFDPYAPADAAIALTLDVLLEPSRGERLSALEANNFGFGFSDVIDALLNLSVRSEQQPAQSGEIQRRISAGLINSLATLVRDQNASSAVRGAAIRALEIANLDYTQRKGQGDALWQSHTAYQLRQIKRVLEGKHAANPVIPIKPPPGSPIGQ